MPYSRKPILIDNTNTIIELRDELNAAITKLNQIFDSDNEFRPQAETNLDNPILINGNAYNVSISGSILNDNTFRNGLIENTTLSGTTIEGSNTITSDLNNNSATNQNIQNSNIENSTLNTVTISESSLNGFEEGEDTTLSVSSHTAGETTVNVDSVPRNMAGSHFWHDGFEFTIVSSDDTLNTITVEYAPPSIQISGNIVCRFGTRNQLRQPEIIEPIYSGVVHMDGIDTHMQIKKGDSTDRSGLAEGYAGELFYDESLEVLHIFDGSTVGGKIPKTAQYHTSNDSFPSSPYFGQEHYVPSEDQWYKYDGTQWNSRSFDGVWIELSTNEVAEHGRKYVVNTSSSPITITLPASPSFGDEIEILDGTGSFATNNCVVDGNGNDVNGGTIYTLNSNYQRVSAVYYNATHGWVVS